MLYPLSGWTSIHRPCQLHQHRKEVYLVFITLPGNACYLPSHTPTIISFHAWPDGGRGLEVAEVVIRDAKHCADPLTMHHLVRKVAQAQPRRERCSTRCAAGGHAQPERRVVVTGMGVVSCLGQDPDEFYNNLLEVQCQPPFFPKRPKRLCDHCNRGCRIRHDPGAAAGEEWHHTD